MEFNNKAPEWVNEGTAPSEELKNTGFVGGYKPPASVFNYMFNQYSKSIGETQEKLIATETKTNKNIEEIQEDIENLENGTAGLKPSEVVEGETIHVENSANLPFVGLNVYGKSTQDGEPTPDAPIDISNVGDSGSVEVTVYGKNILKNQAVTTETGAGITFKVNSDGSITVIGTSTTETSIAIVPYDNPLILKAGTYFFSAGELSNFLYLRVINIKTSENLLTLNGSTGKAIVLTEDTKIRINLLVRGGYTFNNTVYPQIEVGEEGTDFEPYKEEQLLTLSTPNGLAGIPVTSGGNYTDTEGQEWICDEIDLERGVYVQRIYTKIFSGNETFGMHDTVLEDEDYYFSYYNDNFIHISDANSLAGTLCTHLVEQTANNLWRTSVNGFSMNTSGNHIRFRFLNITSVDELSTQLSEWYDNGTPLTIIGELATPIETPLTDAEIEAYKVLTTNKPNTTILNDGVAHMKVEYITQQYQGSLGMIVDRVNDLGSSASDITYNDGTVADALGTLTTKVNTNTSNISNLTTRVTNVETSLGFELTLTLTSGETSLTFTDSRITTSSTLVSVYTSIFGVAVKSAVFADGSLTLTFPAQAEDMTVKVVIK